MHMQSLAQQAKNLAEKKYSSEELTHSYLERIKHFDDTLNSYITVCEEQALATARHIDKKRAQGEQLGPLAGIPIAQKDIFCSKGVRTSCGSKMLNNFISPYDATVIERFNHAGAVMLGKTNMDEFAMGSSNETSFYGAVRNPWDTERVPGGSSGGSASAVAAGLASAATGTDTGGSIRQPASLCGLTGLKPTYGRVSRYGMIAFASSLDQAGPMARSAEDAALLMNVMAGHDPKDSTSSERASEDYAAQLDQNLKGLKIGLPIQYFADELDNSVQTTIEASLKELEAMGATLKDISLPNTQLSVPAYYVIAPAEASSNLSRFDGVRYGYRCENPEDLDDLYTRTRGEGFGDEVKRRILVGTYALSAGYFDAYYKKAQQIRRLIKDDFVNAFSEVDIIAGPSAPNTAFKLGEKTGDPIVMYLEDLYTIAVNLAGIPAISIPAGNINSLPIGLQLIGNYFEEEKLLAIAHQFQQRTDWHLQQSPIFAR